ncbi:MAG: hypothetical protein AB7D03_06815 [Thiomicrospira sp.]
MIENIVKVKHGIDYILKHAADKWWARVMVAASLITIPLLIYFFSLIYLFSAFEDHSQREVSTVVINGEILGLEHNILQLQLCFDSKAASDTLADWYCEQAIKSYKLSSDDWYILDDNRRTELLEKGAIGMMLVDAKYQLLSSKTEFLKASNKATNEEALLGILLSSPVLLLLPLLMFMLSFYAYFKFYQYSITPSAPNKRIQKASEYQSWFQRRRNRFLRDK